MPRPPTPPPAPRPDPQLLARALTIFRQVVAEPADRRAALLDDACGDSKPLRSCVEELLGIHIDEESPAATAALRSAVPLPDAPGPAASGSRLGAYRILGRAGAGGMGVVYRAEQEHPSRIVALKVLRLEHDSDEVRARFRREVQVLASLQHPSIAQMFDAGTFDTEWGAMPYFAMEYVDGVPIDVFVREHGLDSSAVCRLMIEVADAVQHAHERGVVHRDLKPSNILVSTLSSGRAQPKVLDFGIARRLDTADEAHTLQTAAGQLLGTLGYMSPEAVACAGTLDHRADVYSLGVVLFQLLSGQLPFDLRALSVADAAATIARDEPTRLSAHDPRLRGDLEVVVQKAMATEPEHRYPSAMALADDLRRFLANQPVRARPHSTWYHVRKTIRRHRTMFSGIAATLVTLAGGLVAALALAHDNEVLAAAEREQRDQAVETRDALDATLYRSEMRFVAEAVRDVRSAERARRLLARWGERNHDSRPDPRGFEWFVADAMVRTARLVVEGVRDAELRWGGDGIRLSRREQEVRIDPDSGAVEVAANTAIGHDNTTRTAADGDRFVTIDRGGFSIGSHGTGEVELREPLPGNDARISPDGRLVAIAGQHTESLFVYDTVARRVVGDPVPHHMGNRSFEFSPDNRWLATACDSRGLKLWDVATMRTPRELELPTGQMFSLQWSGDGKRIAVGYHDGRIVIVDVRSDAVVKVLEGHLDRVTDLRWDRAAERLATTSWDATVRVFDVAAGTNRVLGAHYGWGWRVAWSPDERHVASSADEGKLRIFAADEGKAIRTLIEPGRRAGGAEWTDDGRALLVGYRGHADLVDAASGTVLRRIEGDEIQLAPGGRLYCELSERGASVRETATGVEVATWPGWRRLRARWHPAQERLAIGHEDGIWLWSPGAEAVQVSDSKLPHWLRWHVCGDRDELSALHGSLYHVVITQFDGQWHTRRHTQPNVASSYATSPDGSHYLFNNRIREIEIRDQATGEQVGKLIGHRTTPRGAEWSPDGERIVSWGSDRTIRLWHAATHEEVFSLQFEHPVGHVTWSPDSKRLAVVAGGGLLIVDGSGER